MMLRGQMMWRRDVGILESNPQIGIQPPRDPPPTSRGDVILSGLDYVFWCLSIFATTLQSERQN